MTCYPGPSVRLRISGLVPRPRSSQTREVASTGGRVLDQWSVLRSVFAIEHHELSQSTGPELGTV